MPARMGAEPPPDLKHGVLHGVEAVVGRRAPNGLIDLLLCERNVRVGIEQVEDTKLLSDRGIACIPTTARRPAGSMDSRGEPGEIPQKDWAERQSSRSCADSRGRLSKG